MNEKDFYVRLENNTPSIGWMLGHILISHDFIINHSLLGNEFVLPKEHLKNYNTGSSGNLTEGYNPLEMMTDFKKINKIIVSDLLKKSDSWLEEFPQSTKGFPSHWQNKNNMKIFVFHINHALSHIGQILEIKRKLGKRVWGV